MREKINENTSFSTKIIAADFACEDVHHALSMPIYKNAAFEFDTAEEMAEAFQNKKQAHLYSRISNPTVENLERKIQAASGANSVMALASGMAAIANTFMAIGYAGCNIVSSPHLFGNTFSLFKMTLAEFGMEPRFVNFDNLNEVEEAIDENTVAVFCELITNPHLEIANLPELSKRIHAKRVPLIIDATLVPWCAFDARKAGVDIELVSTTKYISGGATSIGGVILDYGTFDWSCNKKLNKVVTEGKMSAFTFKLRREIIRNLGGYMDADTAYLQSLGMESLEVRFTHMAQSAHDLAIFLSQQSLIKKVCYPNLEGFKYKTLSDKLFDGNPCAVLTFSLESKEACYRFLNNLKVIRLATNLFDNKSLIIHPESTIYGTFSDEMKVVLGIEENLLRLSVGLEGVEDLKRDIIQALEQM